MVARVVAPSTAAALRPAAAGAAPVRAYSRKYGQRDRPRPYHKQKRRSKMLTATPDHDFQRNGKPYKDSNDPRLLRAHNNQALRTAKKTCFAEQLAAFEEAAAGFANPPELHFATMLERPPIITADEMPWETAFRAVRDARRAAEKPETPAELERMLEDLKAEALEAQRRKREAALSGGGVNNNDAAGPAHETGPGTTKDRRKAKEAAETESKYGADDLERRASALRGEGGAASQFVASSTREVPRTTKNDELGNTRTLDRAFADRLVLVVREASTGRWVFPGASFDQAASLTAEPVLSPHGFKLSALAAAVHRSTTDAFGQDLNFWVVGSSPMAVHLQPYDEEEQSRRQSYGRKVFLFRADILDGRVEMPSQYDDHQWLSRLEIQKASLFADEGFASVAHDALGCSEQEFVHLAGCKPTASGRPSQAAVDEAAADILRLRGVGLDSAAAGAGAAADVEA